MEVWSEMTGTSGSAETGTDGSYIVKGLYSSPDFVVQVRDAVKGTFSTMIKPASETGYSQRRSAPCKAAFQISISAFFRLKASSDK
ncbi:MAG: hypothetical protein HC887_04250 [Desulfobacteraceae bacterium]|nr:hypothetical protein [Desulfobacteraceae bacterium]